jgi:hypothetical protein
MSSKPAENAASVVDLGAFWMSIRLVMEQAASQPKFAQAMEINDDFTLSI